jgi:hypothetical protein
MDIQIFDNDTLKIKLKKTTLAVDPKSKVTKFDADAVLVIDSETDPSRVNESRVTIVGAGEYEVSGLKISGIKSEKDVLYGLSSGNSNILVAKASSLEKISSDKLDDYQIVILNADSDLNQSLITAMEPNIVILYGEKNKEGAKLLGNESAQSTSKISISEDKLPEELEVMLLG